MTKTNREAVWVPLKNGELIIVFDDVVTGVGTLVGAAETVTSQNVNLMTKIGKGLVYVGITEQKANQLSLPFMVDGNEENKTPLTVSVDHVSTTTGISAFERADTIKAFTNATAKPEDFRRPGHVFPLVSKDKGLLQRIGIAEAATQLAGTVSASPIAYICEILNDSGEIAMIVEIRQLAETHALGLIQMSEILELQFKETLASFSGHVIKGRELGRKIGFPTANLFLETEPSLEHGVYGVTVTHKDAAYLGVMNCGIRPTFKNEKNEVHVEVQLLNFKDMIYGDTLNVEVNFFIRNEISFSSVDQLMDQIKNDVAYAEKRFGLLGNRGKLKTGRQISHLTITG